MKYIHCGCAIIFLSLLAGCFGPKKQMVEYMPEEMVVVRNKTYISPRPDWRTAEHMSHIREVFDKNDIEYKIKDGKLLIPQELQNNPFILPKYSMMANDPNWGKPSTQPAANSSQTIRAPGWVQTGGIKKK